MSGRTLGRLLLVCGLLMMLGAVSAAVGMALGRA